VRSPFLGYSRPIARKDGIVPRKLTDELSIEQEHLDTPVRVVVEGSGFKTSSLVRVGRVSVKTIFRNPAAKCENRGQTKAIFE
jgi:hypothetical protein